MRSYSEYRMRGLDWLSLGGAAVLAVAAVLAGRWMP